MESLFKRRTGCGTSENQIYINKDSKKPEPLTEEKINNINQMVNDFASESLRTIAIDYKEVDDATAQNSQKIEANESGFSIIKDEFVLESLGSRIR